MHSLSITRLLTVLPLVTLSWAAILHHRSHQRSTSTDPDSSQCANEPQTLSCENTTAITNTCCSPTPGGLVLQTQFWDTHTGLEKQGQVLPKNNWTIHGLWPDNCDSSFDSYCDFSRQYDVSPSPSTVNGQTVPKYSGPTVDTFVTDFGRSDLLTFMKKYWVSQGSKDTSFWAHEFSKHGTCFSTFDTKCYSPYTEHEDVVNFFDTVTKAYLKYPTYQWLADANITPSNSTTYTLSAIQGALKQASGATPYLGCQGGALSEVWYFNHVAGAVQDLQFTPVDSTTATTCPSSGIHYYQRANGSEQ